MAKFVVYLGSGDVIITTEKREEDACDDFFGGKRNLADYTRHFVNEAGIGLRLSPNIKLFDSV